MAKIPTVNCEECGRPVFVTGVAHIMCPRCVTAALEAPSPGYRIASRLVSGFLTTTAGAIDCRPIRTRSDSPLGFVFKHNRGATGRTIITIEIVEPLS